MWKLKLNLITKLNKMSKAQVFCLFMIMPFLKVHSDIAYIEKRGCLGDSIKLVSNIVSCCDDIEVYVYKNEDMKYAIGIWRVKNGNKLRKKGQNKRLVFDKEGNIGISKIVISDEAQYIININTGNLSKTSYVALYVMVPPTHNCKPNIIRSGNTLFAEVKTDQCGRPQAFVSWQEHPGISISRQVVALLPAKDVGTFIACMDGDSMSCIGSPYVSKHCSCYEIDPSSTNAGIAFTTLWFGIIEGICITRKLCIRHKEAVRKRIEQRRNRRMYLRRAIEAIEEGTGNLPNIEPDKLKEVMELSDFAR